MEVLQVFLLTQEWHVPSGRAEVFLFCPIWGIAHVCSLGLPPSSLWPYKLCLSPLCALGLNASRDSLFPLHYNHLDVCVVPSDFSSTPSLLPPLLLSSARTPRQSPTFPVREGHHSTCRGMPDCMGLSYSSLHQQESRKNSRGIACSPGQGWAIPGTGRIPLAPTSWVLSLLRPG